MVTYLNTLSMYRQQAAASAAAHHHHQQSMGGSNPVHQSPHHQQASHNPGPGSPTDVPTDGTGGQQSCAGWYPGYGHHLPAHHHQVAQQYLDHATDVLPWGAHPAHHAYSHLQYSGSHHAAYQQQQHQQQSLQHQQQSAAAAAAAAAAHLQQHQQQLVIESVQTSAIDWSTTDEANNSSTNNSGAGEQMGTGDASPPVTVSGSEVSSPGTPASPNNATGNNNNNNILTVNNNNSSRPSQNRSPYEWMKKPSYQSQPNPGWSIRYDKKFISILLQLVLELVKLENYATPLN